MSTRVRVDDGLLARLDPEIRRLVRAVNDEGRGDAEVKLRMNLNTTIGAHGVIDQIKLMCRREKLGCQVTTAGGWFAKDHLVELEGPAATVAAAAVTIYANMG